MDSHALMVKEIKQLETKLENQISKANTLERELEELKHESLSLKTELKFPLENIKLTVDSSNNHKDTNILNSKNNSGSIKPQSTNISNISHGSVTVFEQDPDNSNLDFNVFRDIAPRVLSILAMYTSKS